MKQRFSMKWLIAFLLFACLHATAAEKIGVLMMHGKNPGSASDPGLTSITAKLESAGMLVKVPDMPWSRQRYLDADWNTALHEVDSHVKALRAAGATKIVLAGHSMGCPAALAFASRQSGVDALVLLAPGHVPKFYATWPQLAVVRESLDKAREMIAKGEGDTLNVAFNDINQGRRQRLLTTPKLFFSYFDPESDAEMSVAAPKIPKSTAVLWVIGDADPLFGQGRAYVFDKLPANPKHLYLEISANHLSTPAVSADQVVSWIQDTMGR
jgi:pimeloyl-ACP methyl ester carboxylesterase